MFKHTSSRSEFNIFLKKHIKFHIDQLLNSEITDWEKNYHRETLITTLED